MSIESENKGWGFWGTIARVGDAPIAWELACSKIAAATEFGQVATRDFLDSSRGRHFADDVANGLAIGKPIGAAIDAAVEQWMSWRIGARVERETGIPRGLPYLTGWVGHLAAEGELT